jgi:hypothetical protein
MRLRFVSYIVEVKRETFWEAVNETISIMAARLRRKYWKRLGIEARIIEIVTTRKVVR